MNGPSAAPLLRGNARLKQAVYQHKALSKAGLSERLFTLLFSGLVYPQIWEDPDVDMDAMQLGEGHRVITIASGGCNVLAYLTRSPALIEAVDLNAAHVALNRLKLAALQHLPSQADFHRFFAQSGNRHNGAAYDRFIAPYLDQTSRRYWERKTLRGRRVDVFQRDFYRTGLLGWFIAAGHFAARLHGIDPRKLIEAHTVADQRRFFDEQIAPAFDRRFLRWATAQKASLFGLGIPPAQYDSLVTAGDGTMTSVLKARLEKLACDFPLKENYFAWQAFARRYPNEGEGALPAYLEKTNFQTIRDNARRVTIHHANVGELLARKPAGSVDRFVLLDAQDWMTDAQLNALWTEITRTAAAGGRVIFRTAAEPSILEGRVSKSLLDQWEYRAEESRGFGARDRSAIYGGFHLYVLKGQ